MRPSMLLLPRPLEVVGLVGGLLGLGVDVLLDLLDAGTGLVAPSHGPAAILGLLALGLLSR